MTTDASPEAQQPMPPLPDAIGPGARSSRARTTAEGAPTSSAFDATFLRKLEQLRIESRRPVAGRHRGERRSPRQGGAIEFADFRPYHPGDDFRRIDWPAYARLGQLVVKLFAEEEDLSVYVALDRSASMAFGSPSKFDVARRLAACLAYVALAGLDRVTVFGFAEDTTDVVPPTRGKSRIFSVLDSLDRMESGGRTSLDSAVSAFLARRPRPGVIVLIGDFLEADDLRRPLARLRHQRFQPSVIQLLAPEELQPTLRGDLQLVDSEREVAVDVSVNRRALRLYRQKLADRLGALERNCASLDIPYIRARSDSSLDQLVLRYLRRARVVRG